MIDPNNTKIKKMIDELKEKVLYSNQQLVKNNLVLYTWGNVSQRDVDTNLIAIKPSGVDYNKMKLDDIVILDIDGNLIDSNLKPSSDTPTHLEIYKNSNDVNGICHTHSTYATAFAQAGKDIQCFGTTHADYFKNDIPCSDNLSIEKIDQYEKNTGHQIIELYKNKKINMLETPGCLIKHHGVFTFGLDASEAVNNATILEQIAKLAYLTITLNGTETTPDYIIKKHNERKHGKNAYYGQKIPENK